MNHFFNLNLYFDPIGRYLITREDKILTFGTSVLFGAAVFFFAQYFSAPVAENQHLLFSGLSSLFLGGVLADFSAIQDKDMYRAMGIFLTGYLIGISTYLAFPTARPLIVYYLFVALLVYPLILKFAKSA